jgi:hypothetical protein
VKSAVAVTVDSSKSATASLDTKTSVLTIEVPRGAAGTNGRDGKDGAPGILGWRIVEFVVLGKNDDDLYVGEALCDTDNGYALTGGGFQAPLGVVAIVSRPLKATYTDESNKTHEIGIGWRVVGEIRGDYNASPLTVYAVCACVDADVCGQ